MKDMILYDPPKKRRLGDGLWAGVKFAAAVLLLCGICALTFAVGRFMSGDRAVSATHKEERSLPIIVIDAGHGGIDGGAVAPDGTTEKDINLDVAKRLEALCRVSGIECVMTRTDDHMLTDESLKSHRKMHDLKNRLGVVKQISESGSSAVLVSIHMNNFSSSEYSGLQVWYSPNNENSAQLATYVQSYARTYLDRDNTREIKRATSAIYLLDRADVPAILIECGFLSNSEELARLKTDEYRTELAVSIFASVCGWMGNGSV